MSVNREFPKDFQECVRFHGHVCPGLAIGYAAAKAAERFLGIDRAGDEEVVAVVENDSCAVDAVQVVLGCTFGKGNLVFRDWGKQVFTFMDRKAGRAVRVSFVGPVPGRDERHALKEKLEAGQASPSDTEKLREVTNRAVEDLIGRDPALYFQIREVRVQIPPCASIVQTRPCDICGEATVTTRLVDRDDRLVCKSCASEVERA